MSTEESTSAVLAALTANLGIAVTKALAFALTGSASVLAEAVHSVADSGNQVLLLVGRHRAARRATPEHPFGYGRQRYSFAFVVSIVLFTVGGLFALAEAVHKWGHPEPIEGRWWWVPVVVLGISLVLESLSLRTAIRAASHDRAGRGWAQYLHDAKSPEVPVVLLEDTGALIGLVCALGGVVLTLATGDGRWDAVGTALIGLLLVGVAAVLGVEMHSLLLGEAALPEHHDAVVAALVGPGIHRVIHIRTVHLGPEELLVAAKVAVDPQIRAAELAVAIDEAEVRVRSAVPIARLIYLEPDVDRGPDPEQPADASPAARAGVPSAAPVGASPVTETDAAPAAKASVPAADALLAKDGPSAKDGPLAKDEHRDGS